MFSFLVCLLLGTGAAFPQTFAEVPSDVRHPSGAVAIDATITLTNSGTTATQPLPRA